MFSKICASKIKILSINATLNLENAMVFEVLNDKKRFSESFVIPKRLFSFILYFQTLKFLYFLQHIGILTRVLNTLLFSICDEYLFKPD